MERKSVKKKRRKQIGYKKKCFKDLPIEEGWRKRSSERRLVRKLERKIKTETVWLGSEEQEGETEGVRKCEGKMKGGSCTGRTREGGVEKKEGRKQEWRDRKDNKDKDEEEEERGGSEG